MWSHSLFSSRTKDSKRHNFCTGTQVKESFGGQLFSKEGTQQTLVRHLLHAGHLLPAWCARCFLLINIGNKLARSIAQLFYKRKNAQRGQLKKLQSKRIWGWNLNSIL